MASLLGPLTSSLTNAIGLDVTGRALRAVVRKLDPELALFQVRTMEQVVDAAVGQPIAWSVAGPYSPSAATPACRCTSITAPAVCDPYSPSIATAWPLHCASAPCSTATASWSPIPTDIPHVVEADEKRSVSAGTRTDSDATSMTTTPSHAASPSLAFAFVPSLVPKSKLPSPPIDSQPFADARASSANSTSMTVPMPVASLGVFLGK